MELAKKEEALVTRRARLDLARPPPEARERLLADTKLEIDRLIALKSGELKPSRGPEIVEYTPKGAAESRELRIVERQNDPLEPPRHRYKKQHVVEVANEETRAPIWRRPPKPLTAEEKKQWEVPASVSNWRNDRGFLIDLDTRAAATPAPAQPRKSSNLASALSEAAADVQHERDEEEKLVNAQNTLRAKLLAQKESSAHNKPEKLDQRLLHSSKRKHDLYADSLFSQKGHRSKRRIKFEK